jgi:hypothetical protein
MLRFALLAVAAAIIVAVGLVLLPNGGSRPDSHLSVPVASAPDPATFVVHDATAPAPGTPGPGTPGPAMPAGSPAKPGQAAATQSPADLDAVMQRLRDSGGQKPSNTLTISPAPTAPSTPPAPTAPPAPPAVPADASPRWTSVTGQGSRWRMAPSGDGYVLSIDLGGGQVANVHVQPAFAALDPTAMNTRVDYLRQTILQSFSSQTASYTFARDGSVSLDH